MIITAMRVKCFIDTHGDVWCTTIIGITVWNPIETLIAKWLKTSLKDYMRRLKAKYYCNNFLLEQSSAVVDGIMSCKINYKAGTKRT